MAFIFPSEVYCALSNKYDDKSNYPWFVFWFLSARGPFLESDFLSLFTLPPAIAHNLLYAEDEVTSPNSRRVEYTLKGSCLFTFWIWAFFLILFASIKISCGWIYNYLLMIFSESVDDSLVLNFCLAYLVS
jgi:hypothetical protein